MKNILLLSLLIAGLIGSLTSCTARWTDEEKTSFMNSCEADERVHGNRNPKPFCDCYMGKLMAKFPDHDLGEAEPDTLAYYRDECRVSTEKTSVVWPESARKVFLTNCIKLATEQAKKDPAQYCSCVLESVIVKYPNAEDLATMNQDSMKAMSVMCDSLLK